MVCSFPPPLNDDQLSAAMDGEADTSVLEHISRCTFCAQRLDLARSAERALHTQLFRSDCPPSQQLGNYQLGLLTPPEDRATIRHVEQCMRCTAELEELRAFLGATDIRPAQAAVRSSQPLRPRLREIIARVLPKAPMLALRGSAAGPLMAEANGTTVILDMQAVVPGFVDIMGQIVAEDQDAWTGALVELRSEGTLRITVEVDDLGSFRCERLPVGIVELRVTTPSGQAVIVPGIELSS